ncbi:MAG TPA: hypothetical protein QF697_06940, partial [Candidatus Marinimicrobia bacterium]|nr:hypothetical protein [Candidatus Neomarinimicrobiota bacterium]
VKERKGIKKHKRQGSFISEYNYEITIVVLIALGIFLLVEDLEIKHYMYLGLRWFLFSIGDIIKGIRDNVILLLEKDLFELSDLVGISLILFALHLAAKRWRDREIERYSELSICPNCGGKLQRVQRTPKQKIISLFYVAEVKNFSCRECAFKGIKMSKKT